MDQTMYPPQRGDRPGGAPVREGASHGAAGVANLGIVRPPLVYLSSVLGGLLVNVTRPLPIVPTAFTRPLGGSLLVVAAVLFWLAVRRFRAAGTPVPGNRPTTAIVRTGPYRFSRNPIYLAMSILHLGVAIWANSVWLVATLAVAVALMAIVVIPREERYLEDWFGADYLNYKASVRRWL